jgi:hypothetical protein
VVQGSIYTSLMFSYAALLDFPLRSFITSPSSAGVGSIPVSKSVGRTEGAATRVVWTIKNPPCGRVATKMTWRPPQNIPGPASLVFARDLFVRTGRQARERNKGRLLQYASYGVELDRVNCGTDKCGDDLGSLGRPLDHLDLANRITRLFKHFGQKVPDLADGLRTCHDMDFVNSSDCRSSIGARLMALTNGRKRVLLARTATVRTMASAASPMPDNAPTAAEHQRVEAVFKPEICAPSFMMTAAPRNPTPDTIPRQVAR